jgi:YD repeat-containing protein
MTNQKSLSGWLERSPGSIRFRDRRQHRLAPWKWGFPLWRGVPRVIAIFRWFLIRHGSSVQISLQTSSQNREVLWRTSGAVLAYTYDAANNVLTASDGSGGTATRTYDQVGRLKTVTDEAGNVTTYGYDWAGFLVSTVLPGGVRQDRVVDAAGQIGQIANSGSAGLIRSFQYTRDASGNPTAVIANGPAGVLEGQSQLFTYDNANRLRRACWTAVVCRNANQTAWTYDVVGKRLTEKVGAAPAKAFTYDVLTDQLTQTVDGTQITSFGGSSRLSVVVGWRLGLVGCFGGERTA